MNCESEDPGPCIFSETHTDGRKPKRRFPPWLEGPTFLSSLNVIWRRKWCPGFEPNKQKCDKHAGLIKRVELNHGIGLKASLPQRYGSFLKQSASNCSTPWKHNTDEEAQISTAVTMIIFSFISFQKTIHLIKRLFICQSAFLEKYASLWFWKFLFLMLSLQHCLGPAFHSCNQFNLLCWERKALLGLTAAALAKLASSVWDYPFPLRGILH